MIELDDCGKELLLEFDKGWSATYQTDVRVIMVIRAPRGTLALFHSDAIMDQGGKLVFNTQARECVAINLFMKEHQHD